MRLLFHNRFGFKGIGLLMLCLTLSACHRKRHHTVVRGFYYWKTAFALSAYEQRRLEEAGCRSLYLRCFDVDWNPDLQRPEPVGVVRGLQRPDHRLRYVPVVFITPQTMAAVRPEQLPGLAANVSKLLARLFAAAGIAPGEVQIDCDWTAASRDAYFRLLTLLRQQPFFRGKALSCTVRLHQVKYRMRSGIPPVDRALIMCYNVGNLRQPGAHNSILDVALVRDYLSQLSSYPLPADVALPLFRWCLHFRGGRFRGILRNATPEEVVRLPFLRQQKAHLYTCTADTVWHSYCLKPGDELRVESPSPEALHQVAAFAAGAVRNDALQVLLFHADSLTLSSYTTHDLEKIYHTFD